jgi:hypothetical protein
MTMEVHTMFSCCRSALVVDYSTIDPAPADAVVREELVHRGPCKDRAQRPSKRHHKQAWTLPPLPPAIVLAGHLVLNETYLYILP